ARLAPTLAPAPVRPGGAQRGRGGPAGCGAGQLPRQRASARNRRGDASVRRRVGRMARPDRGQRQEANDARGRAPDATARAGAGPHASLRTGEAGPGRLAGGKGDGAGSCAAAAGHHAAHGGRAGQAGAAAGHRDRGGGAVWTHPAAGDRRAGELVLLPIFAGRRPLLRGRDRRRAGAKGAATWPSHHPDRPRRRVHRRRANRCSRPPSRPRHLAWPPHPSRRDRCAGRRRGLYGACRRLAL
ncbi:MAG: 16S rRNA (uracil(1498)-N(3))-methyltransferase, partial [uncultured Sphingomonas sp.]